MLTAAATCADTGQDYKKVLMKISIHVNHGSQTGNTFFYSKNICQYFVKS